MLHTFHVSFLPIYTSLNDKIFSDIYFFPHLPGSSSCHHYEKILLQQLTIIFFRLNPEVAFNVMPNNISSIKCDILEQSPIILILAEQYFYRSIRTVVLFGIDWTRWTSLVLAELHLLNGPKGFPNSMNRLFLSQTIDKNIRNEEDIKDYIENLQDKFKDLNINRITNEAVERGKPVRN